MFVTSNIDVQSGVESNNQPWIIMKHIQGSTLREFVRLNSMNFRDKLIITIKLLNIVREMHSRNIVHRHINPENIIIPTLSDTEKHHNLHGSDQINLVLIGFSQACLTQDNEANNRMIFEDDLHHIPNTFYQAPQLEGQSSMNNENERDKNILCSPGIDTSSVCAVLFWLITGRDPKESKNIEEKAPHQLKAHINIIDEELKKATGKSKHRNCHFKKINEISSVKEFGQNQKNKSMLL
jgi:serine/threonine protein kinase